MDNSQSFGNEDTLVGVTKTILLVGETGAGKSTLIDAMFNYLAGVSHGDKFRFQLVHLTETEKKKVLSKSQSQTDGITCYEVPQNQTVNFPVRIIDTPGFGDTRGKTFDQTIPKKLENLFNNHVIDEIDAICLVVPTACVRLSEAQEYVFKSIRELFGKDVEKNIFVLLTKDDGASGKPEVLQSIKAAGINIENDYFRFNNANLFSIESPFMEWEKRNRSFQMFFEKVGSILPISLHCTKAVLEFTRLLEIEIVNIREEIKGQFIKVSNIKSDRKKILENETKIKANESFETTRDIDVNTIEPQSYYSLNCNCNRTCHRNCHVIWSGFIRTCEIMEGRVCKICENKCSDNAHELQQFTHTTRKKNNNRNFRRDETEVPISKRRSPNS